MQMTLPPIVGDLTNSGIASATAAVSPSNVRRPKRIGLIVLLAGSGVEIGSQTNTAQNSVAATANPMGTFQSSGDGRLWSESVHS